MHDTGHSVGAVEHTHGPFDDLDAIDVLDCDVVPAHRLPGTVHLYAIDQELNVVTLTAAHEKRSSRAIGSGLHDGRAAHQP